MYRYIIFILLFFVGFASTAYGQSIDNLQVETTDIREGQATVQISWNLVLTAVSYEIGCVSCKPKIIESTQDDIITLNNITPFANSNTAMLYIIAYDSSDEIINAKQIMVKIG